MDANGFAIFIESAGAAAAVARLTRLKLAKRFPALLAWLIVLGLSDFLSSLFPQRSVFYFWLYFGEMPVACIFGILAVRELLAVVFHRYPGIRFVGRWGSYIGIGLALGGSVLANVLLHRDRSFGSQHLFYLEVMQRSVIFSLALVILTVLFVLSRYPLNLSKNSFVSSAFFSAIFLSDAVRLLIDSLAIRLNNRVADWTEAGIILLCLGTWTLLLQPEPVLQRGEDDKWTKPPETLNKPSEEHLLQQLDSLNRMLTRVARN
jgi:hypothetical protein